MELKHFSHDHILTLIDVAPKSDREEEILCYGCQESITSSAYNCGECNYILHKKCAELLEKIEHPRHQDHTLTLLSHPPYPHSSCVCNVCQISEWKWFTYNCSKCHFNIHVSCAFEEGLFEHEGHHHPLTLVRRPVLLFCDACDTKEKDISYRCTICQFWIHKSCASLPKTLERSDDDHYLRLTYSLPEKIHSHSHSHSCNICHNIVQRTGWIYCCEACRYFAHLKCITSKQKPSTQKFSLSDVEYEPINFSDIKLFTKNRINPQGFFNRALGALQGVRSPSYRPKELINFGHGHPSIPFDDVQSNNESKKREIICDICVRPISHSYYGCDQCNFSQHKNCVAHPMELKHPSHNHPLYLQSCSNLSFALFRCVSCKMFCNGLTYCCPNCDFYIDVNCASSISLPKIIGHKSHKHLLSLQSHCYDNSECNACGDCFPSIRYTCGTCSFSIERLCATLPTTIRHEWDHHLLTQIYPPFSDHPEEFICEICEKELHPNYWIYRCRDCDQAFHYKCVHFSDKYSNIKFGGTFKFNIHPQHNLRLVRKSTNKAQSLCYHCGKQKDGKPVLECAPCNFQLCIKCAWQISFPNYRKSKTSRIEFGLQSDELGSLLGL